MVNYGHPVHVKIVGDADAAAPYVGIGKNEVRRFASELPVSSKSGAKWGYFTETIRYQLRVRDDYWQLTIYAEPCSLYLDSGLLTLGNLAPLHPKRYDNGILYTAGELRTNKVWGTLSFSNGALTGAKDAFPSATSPGCCKNYLGLNEFNVPQYVTDLDTFYAYKLLISMFSPSMLSGKIRLYVQALYGQKYTKDPRPYTPVNVAGVPQLDITNYKAPDGRNNDEFALRLLNIGGNTTGLYTDDSGKFWVIHLYPKGANYQAKVIPLVMTDCGEAIRLGTDRAKLSRQELALRDAAALAGARPDPANSFIVVLKGVPNYGFPLAYGWSFNWNGDQAIMTVVKRTGEGATSINNSRRLTVTIKRNTGEMTVPEGTSALDAERARWTITGTFVDKGTWQTQLGIQNIWQPQFSMQGVRMVLFQDLDFNVVPQGSGEFYSFFDKDDKIVPCTTTITIGASSYTEDTVDELTPSGTYTGDSFFIEGMVGNKSRINYAGGGKSGSITAGGVSVNFLTRAITGGSKVRWTSSTSGDWIETSFISDYSGVNYESIRVLSGYREAMDAMADWIANNPGGTCDNVWRYKNGTRTRWTYALGGGGESERASIVIPAYDCAAVYVMTSGLFSLYEWTGVTVLTGTTATEIGQRVPCRNSPWFDYRSMYSSFTGGTTSSEGAGEETIIDAPPVHTYVGYWGEQQTTYSPPYVIQAPSRQLYESDAIHYTISAAVSGDPMFMGKSLNAAYGHIRTGFQVFVGAA